MIDRIYEIICDSCGAAIYHSFASSKKDACQEGINIGMVVDRGKHFCDVNCQSTYKKKKKLNKEKNNENNSD